MAPERHHILRVSILDLSGEIFPVALAVLGDDLPVHGGAQALRSER
jgi:hypothetical protein